MRTYPKTANEVLDYGRDWLKWLDGDVLTGSSWIADAGLTIDAHSNDNDSTTVWISGGMVGERYALTNRVTSVGGRTAERTFYVEIVQERYA